MSEIKLIKDKDFGIIPGTKGNTLYKEGAIKICIALGINILFEVVEATTNIAEKYMDFTYKCILTFPDGRRVECDGNASSEEARFKYVWVGENKVPSNLIKSELDRKADYYNKSQSLYKVPNPEILSQKNNIVKMAEKRALIGALYLAMDVSVFFGSATAPPPQPGTKTTKPEYTNKPVEQNYQQKNNTSGVTSILSKSVPESFKQAIELCTTEDQIKELKFNLLKEQPHLKDSKLLKAMVENYTNKVKSNKKVI